MEFKEIMPKLDKEIDRIEIAGMVPRFIICNTLLHDEFVRMFQRDTGYRASCTGPARGFSIMKGPYLLTVIKSDFHDGINVFAHLPE